MSENNKKTGATGITAVAGPCSARKKKLPVASLQATVLVRGPQHAVAKAWMSRLEKAPSRGRIAAQSLYAGTGFGRVRAAAEEAGCPLFVISAGLGLVAGTTPVPAYDLTLSPSATTRLQATLTDSFVASQWWTALQTGPFASPLTDLCRGEGRILIALTQPYAALVGPAIATLPVNIRERLRLFGSSLSRHLPEVLHKQIIQYDARLDGLKPGTRLDAASRALAHFASLVVRSPVGTVEHDQQRVEAALAGVAHPVALQRPRVSDETLIKHILHLARCGLSASGALKHLRSVNLVACEERRFRRLYEEAVA